MSHRALVAAEREDGGYDVSLAVDGAADWLVEPLLCPGARLPPGFVDGTPRGRAPSLEAVAAAHLDPLTDEALVVVHPDGSVSPYAVLPIVLATADGLVEGDPAGAAVALVGRDGSVLRPAYLRGWLHGATEALGDAVDAGCTAPEEALRRLADAVRRLAGDRHDCLVVPADP